MAKAVALTSYQPAFKTSEEYQDWSWDQLVTKKTTNRATEQVFSYTGLPAARKTGQLQDVYYASMAELAATTWTISKFTLATLFSYELMEDNIHLPDLMKSAGSSMGESHAFARDVANAAIYNRAFNSSYTGYDSVELCGTHTMHDGTSYVNKGTTASLSFDSLWLGLNHFETDLISHSGIYLRDKPKFLVYHPVKEKQVRAILTTSRGQPGTMNNDKNTVQDYNLIPVPCRHLTTSTNWFIAGSRWPDSVWYFTSDKVKTATKDDFDRMGMKLRTHQRFAVGFKDFMYIYGNVGA
jgi:hypothetical protein